MKKLLSLLVTGALMLSLSAGVISSVNAQQPEDVSSEETVQSTAATEEPTSTGEETADASEPASSSEPASEAPESSEPTDADASEITAGSEAASELGLEEITPGIELFEALSDTPIQTVNDLNDAFALLDGKSRSFVLDAAFAADYTASGKTLLLPALDAGETLTIDGGANNLVYGGTPGTLIPHIQADANNQGTYVLKNLTLSGYGGIVFTSGFATLQNVTFNNMTAPTGKTVTAITQGATELTITDCSFTNGQAMNSIVAGAQPLTITNTTFSTFSGSSVGITASTGSITITDATFTGFTGGKAISFPGASTANVTATNTVFSSFTGGNVILAANGSAGSISLNNSLFTNITGTMGSAILLNEGSKMQLTIANSSFIDNTADNGPGYYGGVIAGHKTVLGSKITISNSYFKNNRTKRYGGAVGLYYFAGDLSITNSYFDKNSTFNDTSTNADGGAVGIFNTGGKSSSFFFEGNTFSGNTAYDDGGAVFLQAQGSDVLTGRFVNNTFINNAGQNNTITDNDTGGAVQLSLLVKADFINNTFYSNSKSGANGGAVGYHSDSANASIRPTATFQNNLFVANTGLLGKVSNVSMPSGAATDNGGNIGYDFGKTLPAGLSATSVFGGTPALAANGTTIMAGASVGGTAPQPVPTLMIALHNPSAALGTYADYVGAGQPGNGTVPSTDQRGYARMSATSAGAVELFVSHTVTFDTQGGDAINAYTNVQHNATIAQPSATYAGHTLVGWYTEDTLQTQWNFDTDTVTADITLYAKWVPQLFVVSFNSNGGSPVSAITNIPFGTAITPPASPALTGKIFMGWYTDSALTTPWDFIADVVTADVTLYAKWTPQLFNVTFNSNGGSSVSPINGVLYGNVIYAPPAPSLSGYTFEGWYKDSSLNTLWGFGKDTVTSNITLYARWSQDSTPASSTPSSTPVSSRPASSTPASSTPASSSTVIPASSVPASSAPVSSTPASSSAVSSTGAGTVESGASSATGASLSEGSTPLGGLLGNSRHWALLNLLIALLMTATSIVLGVMAVRNKKQQNNTTHSKNAAMWRLMAMVAGAAALILFFLTENLAGKMILVDFWTLPTLLLLALQTLFIVMVRRAANTQSYSEE